jgi:hypothetical protein
MTWQQRLSVGTVNGALKIVRIVFGDAAKAKLVSGNEAASVPILKASAERAARRPFTDAELRRVLAVAGPEWRAMILTRASMREDSGSVTLLA